MKQRQLLMMAYGHGGHLVARLLSRYPKILDLAPPPLDERAAPSADASVAAPKPAVPTLRALGLIESSHKVSFFYYLHILRESCSQFDSLPTNIFIPLSSHKLKGDSAASAAARVFFSERTLNWCGGERLAMQRSRGVHSPSAASACNTIAVGDADSEHRALAIATCTPAVFIFFEIALRRARVDFSDPQTTVEGSPLGDVLRLRESLPRLIERNAIAKATLSWPQQYICFQDAFRWRSRSGTAAEVGSDGGAGRLSLSAGSDGAVGAAEGDAASAPTAATFAAAALDPDAEVHPVAENEKDFSYCVYEVSVAHSKVALARGHVRGEGALFISFVCYALVFSLLISSFFCNILSAAKIC